MEKDQLIGAYQEVRNTTETLCTPLFIEDYVIQSMPDVSPPKWHLGHTTWFFEQVILERFRQGYTPYHPLYYFVFNSYYQSFGDRVKRDLRGTLSRPGVEEVFNYRHAVDRCMKSLIENAGSSIYSDLTRLVELGLHHEQQHQELLVTDIKHILGTNPLRPVYKERAQKSQRKEEVASAGFREIPGGTFEMGALSEGFAWDNERPRHKVLINDFRLMDRLVTCGEYLEFMNDGGYRNPLLWLSDGWDTVWAEHWSAPLYWENVDGQWNIMKLSGMEPIDPNEPAAHVSYYEASAYARWSDKRLPTEAEWERAATWKDGNPKQRDIGSQPAQGNFLEDGRFHPVAVISTDDTSNGLRQMFGDVWEWTLSAYLPYPGYRQERGPLGEYNGKFMSNQMILRGGSCATPRSHIRPTYRNFFQCDKRWQFTGIRLASDVHGK